MNELNNEQFITNAYGVLLGRAPDPAGLDGALYKLSIGVPREDVLQDILASEEFNEKFASFSNTFCPPLSQAVGRNNQRIQGILNDILEAFDEDEIGLPASPFKTLENSSSTAFDVLQKLETELGNLADSDYFKCSRTRFIQIVHLALESFPLCSNLLDIGNAPGYLAQALYHAGYIISGINLSEAWNATYPDPAYLDKFEVKACNIEQTCLPYPDQSFDGIVFTEVLEHVAIKRPEELLIEFNRVLKQGGMVLFSTPNVCNLSNILALASGKNVFWPTSMFYGSTDRHNREWTPVEVRHLFESSGFMTKYFYGINDHANWRMGVADQIYSLLKSNPKSHALLRNTIVGLFIKAKIQ